METVQRPLINKQKISLKGKIKRYFLTLLRLTDQPMVKVYRGFGNDKRLTIYGHVFRQSALPRKKYRDINLVNLLAVLRLFLVQPYPHAMVRVRFGKQLVQVQTDVDGYFQLDLPLTQPLSPGWHPVQAQLVSQTMTPETVLAEGEGQVLIPHPTRFICLSDIDDTFLVSHSATIAKRLLVLLTENAHSRRPFDGVVAHYQLLAEADSGISASNPFFYVSSSEWNLYDYILEFSRKNGLPDGIYRLSPLKRLSQLLKTGKGKHLTKVDRIVQIINMYPNQQFILLGDDSQQDPIIYESIVQRFPNQIRCVYIRQVHAEHKARTESLMAKIEAIGVASCYFAHSADARQHSVDIGLVAT
ncbi:App1 family protein [Spirosoma flavum]|uniref:App1 family protein n=1 Tax=Spirosoma flavum TaxID=2048557 RepID=A0ABW6ADE6_9BACT